MVASVTKTSWSTVCNNELELITLTGSRMLLSGSCLCLRAVVISYRTTLGKTASAKHWSAFCTARKGLGTSLGERHENWLETKVNSFFSAFSFAVLCIIMLFFSLLFSLPSNKTVRSPWTDHDYKQHPDRFRSSVVFWLIRSLVDPTLTTILLWGPMQFQATQKKNNKTVRSPWTDHDYKQHPDRFRSSVVFWLIRSLVDPTLTTILLWGPMQFQASQKKNQLALVHSHSFRTFAVCGHICHVDKDEGDSNETDVECDKMTTDATHCRPWRLVWSGADSPTKKWWRHKNSFLKLWGMMSYSYRGS